MLIPTTWRNTACRTTWRTSQKAIGWADEHRDELRIGVELGYLDEIHPGLAANVRSSSINAQHRLIANGAGIGVLPCFMGDFDRSLAAVLPAIRIKRSFWLVTHADTQRFAKIEAFASWIKTIVAQQRADLVPVAK